MSFRTLNVGASSLYASQRAAEVAAHNVANANTPGFTRQRLSVTSAPPTPGTAGVRGDGMRGTGVSVVSIDRMRDLLADLSYRVEAGTSAAADARSAVLDRAEVVLGPFPGGASGTLDQFFAAWGKLSTATGGSSPAARENVLDMGRQMAGALNSAASQLEQLSNDVGAQMQDSVNEVNNLAKHVASLNQAIADAVTAGNSPNDLLDQRDVSIDRLATLTGATVRAGDMQQVDIYVGNSVLVAGVTSREMKTTHTGSTWGVAFVDGPALVGGQLGAQARTTLVDLPEFGRQLDEVAAQLAQQVNAVHSQGYSLRTPDPLPDPLPPPDGGDFFTGTTARTLALRADLDADGIAASAGGARADQNAALDIAQLGSSGAPPLGTLLRTTASTLGAAAAAATRQASAARSGLAGADERRSSLDGVNVDEEMVELVKYQHSYEAAARVISMADGFLDTIINHMGAGR